MSTIKKHNNVTNIDDLDDSLEDSISYLADLTRKEIEKTYNINSTNGTETYYSNRYGWSLRKTVS